MEYQTSCGCKVVSSPPNWGIKYCPLHASALDLYEALQTVRRCLFKDGELSFGTGVNGEAIYQDIKRALAKAKGE